MIARQRNLFNWEFVFLGANIDAVETAESIGISRHMAKTYTADSEGCESTYKVMDKFLSFMRTNDRATTQHFEDHCETILAQIK